MKFEAPPQVGNWYRRVDRPQAFQVVAFDPRAQTVDIEYFDGTVDEWPLEHWHGLEIEPCEAPQDWTGPFDEIERDNLSATDAAMTPEDWHEPLEGPQNESDRRTLDAEAREIAPARLGPKRRRRARGQKAAK